MCRVLARGYERVCVGYSIVVHVVESVLADLWMRASLLRRTLTSPSPSPHFPGSDNGRLNDLWSVALVTVSADSARVAVAAHAC